ncbi:MAG: MBL fold metallo-hydrolase [Deltaproteobacteria bacterium]
MKVTFCGTRGSLPVSMTADMVRKKLVDALIAARGRSLDTREKITEFVDLELPFGTAGTFGGHSSSVQIDTGCGEFILCDCGSGARPFGLHAIKASRGRGRYHIFMSHLHWDHIMGFPFLVPAYVPGNKITIYGCHADLQGAFAQQQHSPFFPVEFDSLGAEIDFIRLEPGRSYEIAGMNVTTKRQLHGGGSFGYRFEVNGKTLVYSTDAEHKQDDATEIDSAIEFFSKADAIIFDAMYSLADSMSIKEDWGHSSNMVGVELAQLAGAKRLCLFHHEPTLDDDRLLEIHQETERLEEITRGEYRLQIITTYDGLELVL